MNFCLLLPQFLVFKVNKSKRRGARDRIEGDERGGEEEEKEGGSYLIQELFFIMKSRSRIRVAFVFGSQNCYLLKYT